MRLVYVLLIIALAISLSIFTYYAYQYSIKPMMCACPAVLLNNVYSTYVYYGDKLILS